MNKATHALTQILSLMSSLSHRNSIDGIELPDTITLDTKDFNLIGDSISAAILYIELSGTYAIKATEKDLNP